MEGEDQVRSFRQSYVNPQSLFINLCDFFYEDGMPAIFFVNESFSFCFY